MSITLTPETQRLLEARMRQGGYDSPDELVRFALRRMDEAEGTAIEELDLETQAAIAEAESQADRGEGRAWEDVRAELKAKYRV